MNLNEAIRNRRSIRKYKDLAIPHSIIEEIVEDASYSPSWKHTQTPRYICIENKELINKIAEDMVLGFDMNTPVLKGCPAIIIVAYLTNRCGYERDGSFSTPKEDRFEMFDAGVASQTLCLVAYEKGLGTVITGYFDEDKISKLIDMPENQKIGSVIGIGYPDETPNVPRRKPVSDLLTFK